MIKITNKIYGIANKVICHTRWYDAYWQGAQKFWNINTFGLDVVNLGSSAAVHAFDYSETGVRGMNWALAPQSLIHDYNILRNYFSYLREGAVVIITVCPFSCLYSKYDKNSNFKYYTFLHPATIIDFDDNERTRALTIKTNPSRAMSFKSIKLTTMELLKALKHRVLPSNQNTDLKSTADTMLTAWKNQFGIADISSTLSEHHQIEQKSRRETLDEIISFCKERDLKPVIVIPPMHHTLTDLFTKEFLNNYVNKFLDGIDAPLYNHMYLYSHSDDYFESALFLNKKGAKVYTKKLWQQLDY